MVFPASAGVILNFYAEFVASFGFPRIRGGDPMLSMICGSASMFSPHPRG